MENVDICNMALSYIAKGRIKSLDEQSEEARLCKIHYEHMRRQLLSAQRWVFAERSVKLALLDKEIPGWNYVYAYPQKCLNLRQVYGKDGAAGKYDDYNEYTVIAVSDSAKAICTNIDDAWVDYTADVETTSMFSPDFTEALARGLAAALAMPLMGSASTQQQQYQLMQMAMQKAKLQSEQEHRHKPEYPETYFNARF